jgi:AraC family transcriptional regulator of adaptative response/methylated-DNA-[protein]-cysteine methyltransferase
MTPTNYRGGAENTAIRFAIGECSLGSILVARSERGVCAIFLGDDQTRLPATSKTDFRTPA